ncbi:hypothetical protein AUG19_01070 [archaeon 13_1_20CM_2_54_9]|nr:MAG: hypothetical protein AUJ07_04775 [Crenarchaeota archaeon 13_1_40CM_3_53_5]OLE77326.1 MAG: hypothetical protein AUG19_01070 [archaeon 13_1_20CM_2_54_9]TMI26677.1 MAG: hypothetical protein E6H36_05095 [Candidatus Bathyarchaeota archaeon]TMI30526.1 MAG: hypothetical protein E6H29_08270 [Candidatus Bathyarchaeota archaeon]
MQQKPILVSGHNGDSSISQADKPLSRGTLDKYRLVIACVRGNVSVKETMRLILRDVIGPSENLPTLVLGPTAPDEFESHQSNRVGWVTFADGNSLAHPSAGVEIISPDNLLEVNLFIEKAGQGEGNQLILGDFLDNIIKSTGSPESFYSFFCQLASRVRLKKRTAILVIKEDIHDKRVVEMVKRFADVVLEFRDRDNEAGLYFEMRTLNFADNIYTPWVPFPQGLKPLCLTA